MTQITAVFWAMCSASNGMAATSAAVSPASVLQHYGGYNAVPEGRLVDEKGSHYGFYHTPVQERDASV